MVDLYKLKSVIETDFSQVIEEIEIKEINELRIILADGSFIDIWYSLKIKNRFSYHWERRFIDQTIYRHDNIPHKKWSFVRTFPKHFHDGSEQNVKESRISDNLMEGTYEFMQYVLSTGKISIKDK